MGEDIRRYITFARKFQPKLSKEAADYLVNAYRQLRQRDGGSSSSASRITVRQLESLIRLAEAMARMYCVSTVTKEHVKEADIDLEDLDNELPMDDAAATEEQSQETDTTEMSTQEQAEAAVQRKKISITFESYKAISNLIVMYLRRQEALDETESSRKSAL